MFGIINGSPSLTDLKATTGSTAIAATARTNEVR
jgi:hypothetical protein